MADDKRGRERRANGAEQRQREREATEDRERGEEAEPPDDGEADDGEADDGEADDATGGIQRGDGAYPDPPHECHRRGCDEQASFVVAERYREETGQGTVRAEAHLCRAHTDEESPSNLDSAGEDYVFRIDPITDATTA
ncbi:uncharacterized protein Nmlp_1651 [Natronomonas moolapensis 8.8.11]|uniref:Uncharacterized protein n=1 Tax=Natronomonas moolapensis (strain DSM 18674 / CECT 7526 / JCM 14361 / 8.8.11) TaxID=268739 RepID=M1XP91_NATM8|nr:hypothetical protein [Natronomonas moolapensis]CCQ35846.1 uncharacterized protein Nmlp_1651 [Natronomonas moolapensis 8.8.11]